MKIQDLRVHAITRSLFEPTGLKESIHRLAFVQADPIRSPARAQDLILRHRVKKYAAGDLEKKYQSLGIEEDFLYAYGFLPQSTYRLLHPRSASKLTRLDRTVLDEVLSIGIAHPRKLIERLGPKSVVNAWGGHSAGTTQALDRLHFRGHLRVLRRDNGIRVYEMSAKLETEPLPNQQRFAALLKVIIDVLGPIPEKSLNSVTTSVRRHFQKEMNTRSTVDALVKNGELLRRTIDGMVYIWTPSSSVTTEAPRTVRFLAPFDPIVWDRRRFEHLWGWRYKFEAYTPPPQRVRGYYAMPILWINQMIGWANLKLIDGRLNSALGFIDKRPREKDFNMELDNEISRIEGFLKGNHP